MNDSLSNQVEQLVRASIDRFDSDDDISPADIAQDVLSIIDPDNQSVELVRYSANLHIRQLARRILRNTFDPISEESPQKEMFEELQDRYPCVRGDDRVYVKRLRMTKEERDFNSNALRKEGAAKIKHADALDSETQELEEQGFFEGDNA